MNIKEKIRKSVYQYHPDVIAWYKQLHAHPELSFNEFETSAFVQEQLTKMEIPFRNNIAGTGILGIIHGASPSGKVLALRADMDALPIREENEIPFRSVYENVMHACGHDAHTATLLGVARILKELKSEWNGTVLLIFQPGEEKDPGGARLMLQEDIFRDYQPDAIVAQHVYVDYPTGDVGFEPGTIMAAADEVHFKIKGKGGHGALPHLANDTVLAASQCIVSLQQIVSRRCDPFNPVVLSFGRFVAQGNTNIIPDEVHISGTLRTMNEKERVVLKEMIASCIRNTAEAYGCQCEIYITDGYPCVINDELLTHRMKQFAEEYLGTSHVKGLNKRMTAEDFGFFSQLYPTTFYRFGIQGKQPCGGLHTSRFLIDENAFLTSVGVMSHIAYRFLHG